MTASLQEQLRQLAEQEYRSGGANLTLLQEFERHLEDKSFARVEDREFAAFRYLVVASADRDLETGRMTKTVIWLLKQSKSKEHIEKLVNLACENTQKTLDAIKKHGGALAYISSVDEMAKKAVAELSDVSVPIAASEKSEDGAIDRAVLERAIAKTGEKVNVVTVRSDASDPYMQQVQQDAKQAMAYVSQGMQRAEVESGTAMSADSVEEALKTAVVAIEKYRNAVDSAITRPDGDPTHFAQYLYDDYIKELPEGTAPHKNLRSESWFIEEVFTGMRDKQAQACNTALHLVSVMDCAVFVPLLALLWNRHAMPRVVEFSRVYRIYAAALAICKTMIDAPTEKSEALAAKKLAKKIAKIQQSEPTVTASPVPPSTGRLTVERIENIFMRMRTTAAAEFQAAWQHAFQVLCNEKLKHSKRGDRDLIDYTSRITDAEIAADPLLPERQYYGKLYLITQNFCLDHLAAMEMAIISYMQDYVRLSDYEVFIVSRQLPVEVHGNSLTTSLVHENNESFTSGRAELWDVLKGNPKFKKAAENDLPVILAEVPLCDTTKIDDERVVPDQPWSPTFAQMKRFHADCFRLLALSPEQQKVAVSIWSADPKK